MKKEICKIKDGVGILAKTREDAYAIVSYFRSCGVNTRYYEGNSSGSTYGVNKDGIFDCTSYDSKFDQVISSEEFRRIISQPIDKIINDYSIY